MMTQVMRLENAEGNGPFTPPFDAANFKRHVPWVGCVEWEPGEGALIPDETHPHHNQDVLAKHFDPQDVFIGQLFGFYITPADGWVTGVKDKEQLLHWFPESSLDYFESIGFDVATYDAPESELLYGDYQLMFDREQSMLVSKVKPTELKSK